MAKRQREAVGVGMKRGGKVEWDDPRAFTQALSELPDGRCIVYVQLASEKAIRSVRANRYYRYALALISKETGNDTDDLHEFYLEEFLKQKLFLTNRHTGEVVERDVAKRSRRLDPEDFWEFVERVRQHAAQFFNVSVPDPDPNWRLRDRSAA